MPSTQDPVLLVTLYTLRTPGVEPGSQAWGGLYDAATLRALLVSLGGNYQRAGIVLMKCAHSTAASCTVFHAVRPGLYSLSRVSVAAVRRVFAKTVEPRPR